MGNEKQRLRLRFLWRNAISIIITKCKPPLLLLFIALFHFFPNLIAQLLRFFLSLTRTRWSWPIPRSRLWVESESEAEEGNERCRRGLSREKAMEMSRSRRVFPCRPFYACSPRLLARPLQWLSLLW